MKMKQVEKRKTKWNVVKKWFNDFKIRRENKKLSKQRSLLMFADYKVKGVNVYENSLFVRSTGCMFGVSWKDNAGNKQIAVEESLPEYVREFVIYHELGHIEAGHLDITTKESKEILKNRVKVGDVDEFEIIADKYVAEKIDVNKTIKALLWMFDNSYLDEILNRAKLLIK